MNDKDEFFITKDKSKPQPDLDILRGVNPALFRKKVMSLKKANLFLMENVNEDESIKEALLK